MPVRLGMSRGLGPGLRRKEGLQYWQRVRSLNPVAYWPLWETSGNVADDLMNLGDGQYLNVTLGQSGIGDGRTCPLFDANDRVNVYSNELNSYFNLIPNDGFETAGAGGDDAFGSWTESKGSGLVSREVTIKRSGDASAALTGAYPNARIFQNFVVVAGDNYIVSFWTRGDGTNAGTWGLYDNNHSAWLIGPVSTGVTGTEWQQVTANITIPSGCTSLFINFYGGGGGAPVYYDDVSMKYYSALPGFNPERGAFSIWVKVLDSAVWSDAVERFVFCFIGTSFVSICKPQSITGTLYAYYSAGGVSKHCTAVVNPSVVRWYHLLLSWDKAADELKLYVDNVLKETVTGLGVWDIHAKLNNGYARIGAYANTDKSWSGLLSHAALFNRVPSVAERAVLSNEFISPCGLFCVGDSKTSEDTWVGLLALSLETETGLPWDEKPIRFATNGYTVANMKDYVDANLAAVTNTPAIICINLGANEATGSMPAEATWKANYRAIIDAFRVKWPGKPIYLAKAWVRGQLADCNTLAGWIDDIVAGYPSGVFVGPDERIWLENGDDGATYTSDGVHYNAAAQAICAARWITALGY